MIDYGTTKVGDKLRIIGAGAPGFASIGDIVEVASVSSNRVDVKREDGFSAFFALTCGAARLEPVGTDAVSLPVSPSGYAEGVNHD